MADDSTADAGDDGRSVFGLAACEGQTSAADSDGTRGVSAASMAIGTTRS